jgi:hypothetical protein
MHPRAQRLLKQKADNLRPESHILSSTRTALTGTLVILALTPLLSLYTLDIHKIYPGHLV